MQEALVLVAITGALLIGAVSPGPSFVLVSRIAVTGSRMDGLAAAIGMGLGGAIFAVIALLGLITVLEQVGWLYAGLRLAGGIYLVYLGIRIWRGASQPLETLDAAAARPASTTRSMMLGFVTQICNPKTAIVYAGIFAAFLPASAPTWLFVSIPPLVFLLETAWYAFVALAFLARKPRSIYLRWKGWFDRAAGAVMGGLGTRLASETLLSRS
ncbi:LysE family translocator [Salinarimonas ramus]|uniref:Threonine transporter n=1 Tax=Salinarimonas ramus TaxID=690164 RepID=A0A917QCC4_9HYPH|nr:LysE family transporter [Salinarimonas ramus]GGK44260.1 threonine transporter [Salinarimonas ramus]